MMKKTPFARKLVFALAVLALGASACQAEEAAAEKPSRLHVMVLTHPDPKFEGNIYKFPLEKIGATYMVYTTDQIDDAMTNLASYDIIMLGLLANANLLTPHAEALRKWVRAGGAICIFDACDGSVYADFCQTFVTDGSDDVSNINCRGCVGWENTTRYGFVLDPKQAHPLRNFPRRVRYECRQWHCLRATEDWTTVATCSGPNELHPVVAVRRMGRGFVYVAAMQQRWSSVAEDLRAFLMCCRLGLEPVAYEQPQIRPGKEQLTLRFRPFDGVDRITAELTVTDAKGVPKKTRKDFKATSETPGEMEISFPVSFKTRGAAAYRLDLKTALGERTVIDEKAVVPEALAVSGPLYRSRLSASRRTDTVSVKVEAYPDAGRTKADSALVKIVDPKGAVVAKAKAAFPEDLTSNEVIVKVPLSATTPLEVSDGWQIQAAVTSGGKTYKAESKMTVVGTEHPGEVTVDEDKTLIVDGKPFYPVVIYHIRPEYYKDAADMGFNTIQTFQWFSRKSESFHQAQELGLKVFFENNEKEPGGFYHMPAKYRDEPSMLFWYLPDEPLHEVDTAFVNEVAKILANDPYHPLVTVDFNSPRFEANAARCDILAPDCYVVKKGEPTEKQPYLRVVDSMDVAHQAVAGRKPVMHVLGAFGHENETDYMMTAFLSIVRDARGLMWYAYDENDGERGVRYHEESRSYLAMTVKKVNQIVPYLLNPVRRPFEAEATSGGKLYGMVCGTENGALIVVNPTDQSAQMPTVPEIGNAKTTSLFGEPDDPARANMIDPFTVRVVTWTGGKRTKPAATSTAKKTTATSAGKKAKTNVKTSGTKTKTKKKSSWK